MTQFHGLYERYAPAVRRFALFLSGDVAVADDITSETFVRLWTSTGTIRESTMKAYLFAIARNLYRDVLRRNRRRAELDESLPDPRPNIDARVEHATELAAVLRAMQDLPVVDRAALLMRASEEMPYEDIAEVLGLSVAAVRVKVHRARVKLMRLRGSAADKTKGEPK
jgi:RNA polymerase sigma-70 factor, ECF subfamily